MIIQEDDKMKMKNSINNEPKNKIYGMAKIFEPKVNLNKSKTLNPSKLKDTSLNLYHQSTYFCTDEKKMII